MPSPREHLTMSLGPQEEREGPAVLRCRERSETPDTVVQRPLGSPQASLACPEAPQRKKRITFRSIYRTLSRVKSSGGAASLLAVTGRIACKDVSLVDGFSCS